MYGESRMNLANIGKLVRRSSWELLQELDQGLCLWSLWLVLVQLSDSAAEPCRPYLTSAAAVWSR